jgi:peptide/nickel transport system ATP-binding protein
MDGVTVNDLRVVYGRGHDAYVAVDGIDLTVPEHGTLGLVGESGSGKSTVARALLGLVHAERGNVHLFGAQVRLDRRRGIRTMRDSLALVSQDPYTSLNPRMRIGTALEEALAVRRRMGRAERRHESARLLDAVELPQDALERYPHEFSGGQRQRIALARALAKRPSVLIADEITSALDVSVQASVLTLLRDIQTQHGLTCLFISHNLAVVRYVSESVAVMYQGTIVEHGDSADLFERPEHPYTRALIAAVPEPGTGPALDGRARPAGEHLEA